MAYIRGEHYIWGDGENIHFNGEVIPVEIVDDFVCMYWHRIPEDERPALIERVSQRYGGGNFGADGVQELLGRPTVMETVLKRCTR